LESSYARPRDHFNGGEVTKTDVAAQPKSLASGRSDYFAAQANLQDSVADYRRMIGVNPTRPEPARTLER
jgi:outer membrane protein